MESNSRNSKVHSKNKRLKSKWSYFLIPTTIIPIAIITTYFLLNNNKKKDYAEETFNNINPIYYNKKYDEKGNISRNYKYGNLSFVEYPYGKDSNGNYLYFLGKEGLKKFAEEFCKRANFGPEINEITNVYVNKYWENINDKNLNGFYNPNSREISLYIKNIIRDKNNRVKNWNNIKIEYKIEMILPTLIHEYYHHVANVYNNSGSVKDKNYTQELYNKLANFNNYKNIDLINKTYTNNKKFLKQFMDALSYNKDFEKYLANKDVFNENNSLFKHFSTAELFRIANYEDPYDINKLNNLNSNRYYFNNSKFNPLKFTEPINEGKITYLYSFEELIPRELMKMTYATSNIINKRTYNFEGMLYFKKSNGIFTSAYGEDILRNISLKKKNENHHNINENLQIASPNWVFDGELKKYINQNKEKIFSGLKENEKLKQLFKSFLYLFGYDLPISYFSFSKLNNYDFGTLGGYLNFQKEYLNKKHYLAFENIDTKEKYYLNINIIKSNFIAKKRWNSYIEEQNWTPSTLLKYKEKFTYISNPFHIKNFKKLFNNKFNVYHWIDKNNDNNMDDDEKTLLNNSESYENQNKIMRSIINTRKPFEIEQNIKALNNSYIFRISRDSSKEFSYSFNKYEY